MKTKLLMTVSTVAMLSTTSLVTPAQAFSLYGSDGFSAFSFGNSTYGSDGYSSFSFGGSTYGSDGYSSHTYGNMTYGSDGTTCMKVGSTIFCM